MTRLVTVAEMKAIEAAADQAGQTYAKMMERAGLAVADTILARLEKPAEHKAVVLCGAGNNGGDGLVAAYYLAEAGASVAVYAVKPLGENDANLQRVRSKGLLVVDAENDQRWRVLKNLMGGVTVLIDAVFGTGVRLPLTNAPADLLKQVKTLLDEREGPPPLRVAVDCPSGLNCDTGEVDPVALPADVTVTFAAAKHGQFKFPAVDFVGELIVADIGVTEAMISQAGAGQDLPRLASREIVRALLPARPRDAHKGTFGRALIAAGSVNYTGAAYLAGAAAYRVGAGLVTLAIPIPIHPALAAQLPEATWVMLPHEMGVIAADAAEVFLKEVGNSQAILVGPGLGVEKETGDFIRRVLRVGAAAQKGKMGFIASEAPETKGESAALPPLVVDADGLRLVAQIEGWPKVLPPESVLTPHPGEMAALTGMDKDAIQADRLGVARKFAVEWGQVVVLKGAFTVIAAPDGRVTVQPFATAALARAGTGDVLAGAIAGLLAQGVKPYEAAVAGCYLHGLAGELAAHHLGTTASVLARDVLEGLIEAMAQTGV